MKHKTDIIIIGAGPVGLFGVFAAGMCNMTCHVIDALDYVGGQCSAMYPDKPIYDIPGFVKIKSIDLITNLYKQASTFKPTYHLGRKISKLSHNDNGVNVVLDDDTSIDAHSIIFATGSGVFCPKRPPVIGIETFENKSVFYNVHDLEKFRDKNIVIAGGGDTALDWIINLQPIAKKVYVLHRRDKFSGSPANVLKVKEMIESNSIIPLIPFKINNIYGENGNIDYIEIVNNLNEIVKINTDIILLCFGLEMSIDPVISSAFEQKIYSQRGFLINPITCSVGIDRVYAAGDAAHYENKLKLILVGFSEITAACNAIYRIIDPEQSKLNIYSTTKLSNINVDNVDTLV